jgi:hypothetical protein
MRLLWAGSLRPRQGHCEQQGAQPHTHGIGHQVEQIAVSPACCGLGYLNQGPVDQEADQHISPRPLVSESTQQGQQQEASGVLGLVPYVEHLRRQFGRGHEREGAHEDHGCPEGGF